MKLEDTNPQEHSSMEARRDAPKVAWERPVLIRMGRLEDFVQGFGKGGSKFDMDPGMTRKGFVG